MSRRTGRSHKRKPKRRINSLPPGLEKVNLNAAGIDVASGMHAVAVPPGSSPDGEDVKEFEAFTRDLYAIASWMKECGVTTVAMESTGVYWIPLYEVLESLCFDVQLVDPRQLKRAPGRKTDILDCQWIQRLHTFGLLSGAFRPDEQICTLRGFVRQRAMLVEYASHHVQHMHKALEQMNIKLNRVITEVTGVTGMRIIRSILAGERDPLKLAAMRHSRCKNDEETIAKSLEGTWRQEHLFALRQAVDLYDSFQEMIKQCDEAIEEYFATLECTHARHEPGKSTGSTRRRNEPHFDAQRVLHRFAGVDLTRIEAIDGNTSLKIISEIGTDVSAWPTVKHFSSWLCLCPGNNKTGGRQRSGRTTPSANRVAAALRIAARSLWNSNSAMGAFLRRLAARKGMPKAITATAHKLARMVYFMLKYGTEYVVRSQEEYERQHKERQIKNLKRRASVLGFEVTQLPQWKQLTENA
jgi:transposase